MKTIKNRITNEIIIDKSRFIAVITPINNLEEIKEEIKKIKKIYKNATHYCYAYIVNNYQKCSDDKEPNGTAGIPILNTLKNNNLTNILCVIVRYFGGIKLGTGGLARAYSSSTLEAINKCEFGYLKEGYKIVINFPYENMKQVDYILKSSEIIKEYAEKVIYTFSIEKEKYKSIEENLNKYSTLREIEDIIMTKDE